MHSSTQHAINRQRTATDRALDIASTCGRLREAARTASPHSRRAGMRELAKKIETRKALNLTLGWWLNRANEMLGKS